MLTLEVAQHIGNIIDSNAPRVFAARLRHFRRRITAGIECDASVTAGEESHLRFPAARIAREFVHENQRRTFAGFVIVKPCVVAGNGVGHGKASSVRIRRR